MTSPPPTHSIARAAGSMSLAVLISRLLGLVREQVFAGFFGAGRAIDAFVVAFRIPNLLRDLFAEGALSTAFVTVFSQYDAKQGPERTWRLANNVLAFLMIVVGGLTLAGIYFSPALVGLMAPDFGRVPGKLELTALMTRIMFPFLLLVSLAALVMGILNTKGKFFLPALASSFFNLGSITAGVGLSFLAPHVGQPPIVGMAVGTLIGGLLQLVVQLPLLFRVGFRLQVVCDPWDPGLRQIFRLMLPAVLGLSAAQINIFINTFYAARCPEGSISWLNYAYRLDHLPQGLFGVALSVATLPLASRLAAREDMSGLRDACRSALSLAMLLTLPAAAGLAVLAEPICALIYQYGRFTAYDTQQTAAALVFYTLGLLAFSGSKILVPVFYALNNTAIPVAGSFLTVAANLVFINLTLEALQHRAIALSMSLASNVSFLFLLAVLHRRLGGLPLRELGVTLAKVGLATGLMALAALTVHHTMAGLVPAGVLGRLLAVAAAVAAGMGVYGLLILNLGIPEAKEALRLLLRRPAGG